jgi:hypothetical protein
MGSNFSTSPKRTVCYQSVCVWWPQVFFSAWVATECPEVDFDASSPPCFTTSSRPDWNRAPSFSLWAHSVSSFTLQHSCSPAIGQRDVNLAGIAHGAFTFYNVL